MFSLLSLLALTAVATAHIEIFDTRSYICRRKEPTGMVECSISFDGNEEWDAINDSGCYQEAEPESQSVIEWCPLQCQDSPRAYITENASACETSSFGVLRRKNDWFLWRAEPCDQQDAVFRVACTRPGAAKKHPKMPMEKAVRQEGKKDDVDDKLPEMVDALLNILVESHNRRKARL